MYTNILIISVIISLCLSVFPQIIWWKKYGRKYIEPQLLPLRKKYRYFISFGYILLVVCVCFVLFNWGIIEGFIDLYYIYPCMMLFNYSKIIFEPYYTTEIIDDLDSFCLYLRPFESIHINKGLNIRTKMFLPEPIEKVLCRRLNKKIAQTYCIGDPNSAIPTTLSTSCIYASDNEWKSAVETLSSKSKLIVLRVVETDGCLWELSHCINLHINKTIFLLSELKLLDLLRDRLVGNNLRLPDINTNYKGCVALFIDSNTGLWKVVKLRSTDDIKMLVNEYIESHDQLKSEVKTKSRILSVFKSSYEEKITYGKRFHLISFLFQPLMYIRFNGWNKRWFSVFVLFELITIGLGLYVSLLIDYYIVIFAIILSLLVWMPIVCKITNISNYRGSRYITRYVNKILCYWVLSFSVVFASIFCLMITDKKNNDPNKLMVENIMNSRFSVNGYEFVEIVETEQITIEEFNFNYSMLMLINDDLNNNMVLNDRLLSQYYGTCSIETETKGTTRYIHKYYFVNELGNKIETTDILFVNTTNGNCVNYSLDYASASIFPNYYYYRGVAEFLLNIQ